jgi:hypothetical protein
MDSVRLLRSKQNRQSRITQSITLAPSRGCSRPPSGRTLACLRPRCGGQQIKPVAGIASTTLAGMIGGLAALPGCELALTLREKGMGSTTHFWVFVMVIPCDGFRTRNAHLNHPLPMTNCPKCSNLLASATVHQVTLGKYRGHSYSCPHCLALLSVAIDPFSLKADIVASVAEELKPLKAQLTRMERKIVFMSQGAVPSSID